MNRTIWVVMGSTGEYSDRSEWLAAAYEDESNAKRHADRATERALAFKKATCAHGEEMRDYCAACERAGWQEEVVRAWMGDLDPLAPSMDYTGTDYVALPVTLRTEVPPVPAPESAPETER